MLGNSWVSAQLAASQEGLSSMSEWVSSECSKTSAIFIMHFERFSVKLTQVRFDILTAVNIKMAVFQNEDGGRRSLWNIGTYLFRRHVLEDFNLLYLRYATGSDFTSNWCCVLWGISVTIREEILGHLFREIRHTPPSVILVCAPLQIAVTSSFMWAGNIESLAVYSSSFWSQPF
jgi:hypothetical protein